MKKIIMMFMIIVIIILAVISCKDNLTYLDNDGNTTGDKGNADFEYMASDDKPVEYNLVNGGDYLQFGDGYLYFRNGTPDVVNISSNTLMRYNVKTGGITTLCPDPLCVHNTPDCIFFGMGNSYYIKNSKISFRRVYIQEKYKLDGTYDKVEVSSSFVSYDIKNNKLTVHERFEGSGGGEYQHQLYVDDYRYYYDIVHDERPIFGKRYCPA